MKMTSDGENDSEALTGGDLTKNRALVARVRSITQVTRSQVPVNAGEVRDGQPNSA